MDVTEQIEEQRTDTPNVPVADPPLPEVPLEAVESSAVVDQPAAPPWPVLNPAWLRLAYVFEFWIALVAIFTVWSQVGGQGHLDLIAWYIKLVCALALAWSAVRMTGAMVENARTWNRAAVRWFVAVLAISTLIVGITYWYHLHEVTDEPDTDENSATVVRNSVIEQNFIRDLGLRGRAGC